MKNEKDNEESVKNEFVKYVNKEINDLALKLMRRAKKQNIAIGHVQSYIRDFSYLTPCKFNEELFLNALKDIANGMMMIACGLVANNFDLKYFGEDYDVFSDMLKCNTITKNSILKYIRNHNEDVIKRIEELEKANEKNELAEYRRLKRKFEKKK